MMWRVVVERMGQRMGRVMVERMGRVVVERMMRWGTARVTLARGPPAGKHHTGRATFLPACSSGTRTTLPANTTQAAPPFSPRVAQARGPPAGKHHTGRATFLPACSSGTRTTLPANTTQAAPPFSPRVAQARGPPCRQTPHRPRHLSPRV
ncbi:hypothetical protein ACOMHN_003627 [Nucella lapillus]